MNARELRLWHWRTAMYARETARRYEAEVTAWEKANQTRGPARYSRQQAHVNNRKADFHIGAVQVMNDHPVCQAAGTTAEQDDKLFPDRSNRKGMRK